MPTDELVVPYDIQQVEAPAEGAHCISKPEYLLLFCVPEFDAWERECLD